jgi:hypothetical protein
MYPSTLAFFTLIILLSKMIGTLKFNPKFATFTLLESLSYCENWFFDGHVYIEKEVLSVIFFLVT